MNERIVIVTGHQPLAAHVVAAIPQEAIILGVDAGLDVALAAGLHPSGLIGDLDSVSPEGLAWADEHATIASHPVEKDETDTELALSFAADMSPERITLVGAGDRLDHSIAAVGALGAPGLTSVPRLDGWWDGTHLDVVHGPARVTLELERRSTLSLLALHGRCENVAISGTRWSLDGAVLEPLVGLGVSNEVTADDGAVDVSVSSGVLTIIDTPSTEATADR